MFGVKRKSSFASPDERPSKLAKRSTTEKLATPPTKPTSLPKFPSTGKKKTKEIAMSGSSPSDGSSDLESPTPPLLRRASTLTVEEKEAAKAAGSLAKKSSSKRGSTSSKLSLTKKISSVVIESGTVTTVVPLKSGSSIGETALVSKESLKKAESITKSLSKTASVGSTASVKRAGSLSKSLSKSASVKSTGSAKETEDDKDEPMDTTMPLPPGGLLEIAISFDTTGSMYGVLEEVRAKVKDLAQRLQADIPGIRIAVIAHGDYCDADKYIVKWIDFGASLPELCDFVENVERTGGGDGPECYELVLKRAREELSWTPGSQRVLVVIGDNEPHPVGYKYGGQTYYIDWKKECDYLKEMGVKVYGVKANAFGGGITGFFKEASDRTFGRALSLKNFTSIFDFLMMICYREGNPDMIPVYESEVRARHKGGMAKDMEDLVKTFGGEAGPSSTTTSIFGTPSPTPFFFKAKKVKSPRAAKAAKRPVKAPKTTKTAKTAKKTKVVPKTAKAKADAKKAKKAAAKTPVKKIKRKSKKTLPKKKAPKLLREKLIDAKLVSGVLKQLEWSDWQLAICQSIPKGYWHKKFQKSSVFGAYHRRNLFDNDTKTPAIYEIGVSRFGVLRPKKYAMYYRVSTGFSSRKSLILYLIRHSKVRKEVERLVDNKYEIHIRRGVVKNKTKAPKRAGIREASAYLQKNFDYAWNRHGKKGHRKVNKHGVMLSDPTL